MPPRREQPITPAADDFDYLLSRAPFRVPAYQRAFDWDTEEVRDFARDALALAECRVGGGRDRHFFGAIISILHPADDFYEVVDGQQRLTTEILCLHELHARWSELAGRAKSNGNQKVERDARAGAARVTERLKISGNDRLTLSKRDARFFADLLAGSAAQPARTAQQSHRRLWASRETIQTEFFKPLLAGAHRLAHRVERLKAAEDALLLDGYLAHLYTTERTQAYRLFSILNDRGRPLSDGALLRTHALAVLENYPRRQEAAEVDWDEILKVGDSFVNAFLAAYYVSFVGDRAPRGEMYDRFRGEFLPTDPDSDQAAAELVQKIAKLRGETETFSRIRVGDWPFDEPTVTDWDRDRLKRLVVSLRHNLAHPLLLAAARAGNEKAFRDLVLLLEPFVFRYINVANASAARLASVYYEHAKKIRDTGKVDKNGLRNRLKELAQTYAPDDLFQTLLRDQLRYSQNAQRRQLLKHFLTTVDDYEDWYKAGAKGKRRVNTKTSVYDLDQVNIEHVYPQNPQVCMAELNPLKHDIGNLTPLDDRDGGQAGNDPFSAKKPIYRKSRFAITKRLAGLQEWNATSVARRLKFYTDRAKKIFIVE